MVGPSGRPPIPSPLFIFPPAPLLLVCSPGLLRLSLLRVAPKSSSTYSSTRTLRTSESDLPREVNTWNDAQRSLSLRDGGTPACFLGLEGAHGNLGDMPFRDGAGSHSTDVGEAYQSFLEWNDPERPGDGGVRMRGGGYMDDALSCCHSVVVVPGSNLVDFITTHIKTL